MDATFFVSWRRRRRRETLFRIDSLKRDGWMDGDATMRCEDDDADRDDNLTR
jgi:hypothetical protein